MKPKFWVPKLWGPSKNGPEEIEFAHRHGHVHPVGELAEAKGEAVEEGAIQTIPATSAMIIIVIATLFLSSSTPEPKP